MDFLGSFGTFSGILRDILGPFHELFGIFWDFGMI